VADLATGRALSSDQPHSLDTVLIGDGDRMIVDDAVVVARWPAPDRGARRPRPRPRPAR